MLLPFIIMFAACTSDDRLSDAEEIETVALDMKILCVGLPGSETARLSMNELTDMAWDVGDNICVYGYADNECMPPEVFELIDGDGTPTGLFSGPGVSEWDKFEVVFRGASVVYSPDVEGGNVSYGYLNQTQKEANDFSHVKNHMLLRSVMMTEEGTLKVISLKPQCCIMKLNVKALPDDMMNKLPLEVSLYTTRSSKHTKRATVKLEGSIDGSGDNYVYMAFDPVHMYAGDILTIGFECDGKEYKTTFTLQNECNYEPGEVYCITPDHDSTGEWKWLL